MKTGSIRSAFSLSWLAVLLLFAPTVPAQKAAPAQSPAPAKTPSPAANVNAQVTKMAVDSSTTDDPAVDKMLVAYSPKVRDLDVVLGNLRGDLRKGGIGAGSLGNFVTDGMRAQASVKAGKQIDLAIMNGGGLRRSSMGGGELRARDIFELLPFENALVTIELNGAQLLRLLEMVVSSREAQSGARITYVIKADKSWQLDTAAFFDNRKIDPAATYTVVTIDYLVKVGGEKNTVLREGRNLKALGITLRQSIMEYVRSEQAAGRDITARLDGRFRLDRSKSVLSGEEPQP